MKPIYSLAAIVLLLWCAGCARTSQTPRVSCLVGGKIYTDGESVPDPYSCNTCTCKAGHIESCTKTLCPKPCPEGTIPGTQCAGCGPVDDCIRVETGCLRTCKTTADCPGNGSVACSRGVCVFICG